MVRLVSPAERARELAGAARDRLARLPRVPPYRSNVALQMISRVERLLAERSVTEDQGAAELDGILDEAAHPARRCVPPAHADPFRAEGLPPTGTGGPLADGNAGSAAR